MQTQNFQLAILAALLIVIVLGVVGVSVYLINLSPTPTQMSIAPAGIEIALARPLPKVCHLIQYRVAPTGKMPSLKVRVCQ